MQYKIAELYIVQVLLYLLYVYVRYFRKELMFDGIKLCIFSLWYSEPYAISDVDSSRKKHSPKCHEIVYL